MKDKEKQIEEMANIIHRTEFVDISGYEEEKIAEELLKHYQPKLPEDSVVLSKEEYDLIDHNIRHLEAVCNAHEKEIAYWEDQTKVAREEIDNAVKETAEKILKELKKICEEKSHNILQIKHGVEYCVGYYKGSITLNDLDELAKQFGVEIKE